MRKPTKCGPNRSKQNNPMNGSGNREHHSSKLSIINNLIESFAIFEYTIISLNLRKCGWLKEVILNLKYKISHCKMIQSLVFNIWWKKASILRTLVIAIKYPCICFGIEESTPGRIIIVWHFTNFELWIHRNFDCICAGFHFSYINPLTVKIEFVYIGAIYGYSY